MQNCLHLAVKRNHMPMVQYLLSSAEGEARHNLLNQQTEKNKESPIFFALNSKMQKNANHFSRVQMVNLLLSQQQTDLSLTNKLG
mmetsp:Transcript_39551/g.60415  ORF Transcript_39551/g.60415 Transcript_39551/m.60415 type:complete len:85 (-) Transcript_39551:385-639(-)